MDKAIERVFRFIEMIGLTALIKAVIVPFYPGWGTAAVGILTALATAYLVFPASDYCTNILAEGAKTKKAATVGIIITIALFLIIQVVWLQPLVLMVSDLKKRTISLSSSVPKVK